MSFADALNDQAFVKILKEEWSRLEKERGREQKNLEVAGRVFYREEVMDKSYDHSIPWQKGKGPDPTKRINAVSQDVKFLESQAKDHDIQLARLHETINGLKDQLNSRPAFSEMEAAALRYDSDVSDRDHWDKLIGYSNRIVVCGLGGNLVAGPVVGYLTSNLAILICIEVIGLIIFLFGIARAGDAYREKRDADKKCIASAAELAGAINQDASQLLYGNKKQLEL